MDEQETTSTEETQDTTETTDQETTDTSTEETTDTTTETESKDEGKEADGKEEKDTINPDDFVPEERSTHKPAATTDDDDDDIDPEDKARIDKRISKQLTPLQQTIQKQNDEIEVNSYIMSNPEAASFKPVIMKYLAHPAYANIPVKNIAAIVMSDRMQKIGAQKEREAQKKVAATKTGGSQQRKPTGSAVDWSKATPAEVEAQIAKVKGQV